MSKANPAVIGAFVIGAVGLLVVGLLLLGKASWFAERNTYIAYFPGSVKGLRVGAPVDFRGVTIGEVTDIRVLYNAKEISARIPVVMQFDPARIDVVGMTPGGSYKDQVERMIEAGFRAQLQSQSLLTGLLFVNLDFDPGTPVRLMGGDQPEPEIPTLPSGMEQLQQTAGDIAKQLPDVIDRLNHLLNSVDDELQSTSGNLTQIVADVAVMARSLRDNGPALETIVSNAKDATGKVGQAATTLDQTLESNRDAISSLIKEWTATAGAVRRMADQINAAVAENREGLRDFTQTGLYEYTGLAQDAQRMVDQITAVADELKRDPARFLFGNRIQGVGP
jgi:phospholipid/cholesterol/gamma-HCH transport system substrate-binding protein